MDAVRFEDRDGARWIIRRTPARQRPRHRDDPGPRRRPRAPRRSVRSRGGRAGSPRSRGPSPRAWTCATARATAWAGCCWSSAGRRLPQAMVVASVDWHLPRRRMRTRGVCDIGPGYRALGLGQPEIDVGRFPSPRPVWLPRGRPAGGRRADPHRSADRRRRRGPRGLDLAGRRRPRGGDAARRAPPGRQERGRAASWRAARCARARAAPSTRRWRASKAVPRRPLATDDMDEVRQAFSLEKRLPRWKDR